MEYRDIKENLQKEGKKDGKETICYKRTVR